MSFHTVSIPVESRIEVITLRVYSIRLKIWLNEAKNVHASNNRIFLNRCMKYVFLIQAQVCAVVDPRIISSDQEYIIMYYNIK